MIGIDKLKDGEYYDGLLWYDGRQRGVATMKWTGTSFGNHPHVADVTAGRSYTFEPNVVSTEESAS